MYLFLKEMENTLIQHPDVAEVCAVALEQKNKENRPHAFVVLRPKTMCSAESLIAFCAERLSRFQELKEITIVPAFPKNRMGGVNRDALVTQFHPETRQRAQEKTAKIA